MGPVISYRDRRQWCWYHWCWIHLETRLASRHGTWPRQSSLYQRVPRCSQDWIGRWHYSIDRLHWWRRLWPTGCPRSRRPLRTTRTTSRGVLYWTQDYLHPIRLLRWHWAWGQEDHDGGSTEDQGWRAPSPFQPTCQYVAPSVEQAGRARAGRCDAVEGGKNVLMAWCFLKVQAQG